MAEQDPTYCNLQHCSLPLQRFECTRALARLILGYPLLSPAVLAAPRSRRHLRHRKAAPQHQVCTLKGGLLGARVRLRAPGRGSRVEGRSHSETGPLCSSPVSMQRSVEFVSAQRLCSCSPPVRAISCKGLLA